MIPAWLTDTVTSDLDRALHYTTLWGLEAVELRTVGGPDDRVPHVNEEKLRRRLEEHDIDVAAIVPGLFEGLASQRAVWLNDLATLADTLRFCRRIGCTRIVASSFAREEPYPLEQAASALRQAGTMAAREGLVIAVLNEVGMACATGAALADLLNAADHPAVCAAWNPAEAVQAGEAAADGLSALTDRIDLVRCADGRFEGETWIDTLPGDGFVDWPEQLRRLYDMGFEGPISLEIYLDPRPTFGLRAATGLIQMIRQARRA